MQKILLVISLLTIGNVYAQKKQLTMQDALVNNRTTLAPENLRQLQFVKGTNDYIYVKKIDGRDVWVRGNFKQGSEKPYLTLEQFNQRLRNSTLDTVATLPPIQFNNDNWIVSIKGQRYAFNAADTGYKKLAAGSLSSKQNYEESTLGYAAYIDSNNLFVIKDNLAKKVTSDGSANIVYASAVHQQEFGITKGTFWSNNAKMLAFYRMDQHMVPDYPIIDWTVRPAKVNNVKYPMSGDKSHHVTVGVYDYDKERLIYLKTGEPAEQYLTNIAWSPDDKFILIAVLNREQNHMRFNQYDAISGDLLKTIYEEKHDKYVEPLTPPIFLKDKSESFIIQSRRNGWNHLYRYSLHDQSFKQLTSGPWDVTDLKFFNARTNSLLFMATKESPLTKNLYRLDLGNNKITALTQDIAVHVTTLSESGEFAIDNFSSLSNPRTIQIINTKTGKKSLLLQAADPLASYQLGQVNIFTIKAKDGSDLYCRTYKPVDFDSTKKYPVLVYWYGGPHAQMITNGWNGGAGDYWFQYMAQKGFLVFSLDTRGSSNRGLAFEQALFRAAGSAQMEDMQSGVGYLNSLPYADKNRMALFGWSYGGFLTTNFLLNHPGIFKAGVAGGPVMDWKLYEIMYTERYMDTPQENPVGFGSTNLIKQAGKLKDKLLLIHGLQDPVVLQQHSVMFVKSAIEQDVQVDYMIYPGHEHNVLGKDRAHLYQKITDYIMQNVK